MLTDERLTLRATPEAWQKLSLYIRLAPGEVGGLASVQPVGPDFLITEIYLINQRATDVDTELDQEAVSRFLMGYLKRREDPATLQLWWHSHGRESVFWSADDRRTIERFGSDQLISLIGNHAGKFLARLDRFRPVRQTVGWVDFNPPEDPPPLDGAAADQLRQELAERVQTIPRRTNKPWTDRNDPPHRH